MAGAFSIFLLPRTRLASQVTIIDISEVVKRQFLNQHISKRTSCKGPACPIPQEASTNKSDVLSGSFADGEGFENEMKRWNSL
jgi:hypothetical protein